MFLDNSHCSKWLNSGHLSQGPNGTVVIKYYRFFTTKLSLFFGIVVSVCLTATLSPCARARDSLYLDPTNANSGFARSRDHCDDDLQLCACLRHARHGRERHLSDAPPAVAAPR